MSDRFLGWLIILVSTAGAARYVYVSWVKPVRAKRILAKYPIEVGTDQTVSSRTRVVQTAWRYNDWTDRIISLIFTILVSAAWWFVATH